MDSSYSVGSEHRCFLLSKNICHQGTSPYLVPVQYYPAPNFVPVYSRPTRSVVDQVVEDDTPEVVRMTTPHYYSLPPPPPYYPYYLPAPLPPKSNVSDDLHYRMRPSLDSVVSRDYSQYGPLAWSWTDFTRHNRNSGEPTNWESLKPHFISGTPVYSGRDSFTPIPDRTVYNKYLTSDYRSTTDTKHKKESTPYFLKSNLPVFGTKNTRYDSVTLYYSKQKCFWYSLCLENTTSCLCLTLNSHFGNTKQILFPMLRIKVCMTQVLFLLFSV